MSEMNGVKEFDNYTKNKKAFRKKIRECKNGAELVEFLNGIAVSSGVVFSNFCYQLYCKNKYDICFADIYIYNNGDNTTITGYRHTQGFRKFRSIKEFSYNIELVKFNEYGRSFGIEYHDYNKK